MNVSILTVGDELLIGQVVDTNSAWMGQQLNASGYQVHRIFSVGDTLDSIRYGIARAFESADIVLMTGGLGPTKDDITKVALADYFGVELQFHEPTFIRISKIFEKYNRPVEDAHRQQAMLPSNAVVLPNKMGTAPGMWIPWNGKVLVSMPGVPFEMKYLMEFEVIPRLKAQFPGKPIAHRTLLTVGEGESFLADRIRSWEEALPDNLKLAYLPAIAQVRLRISGSGDQAAALNAQLDAKAAELAHIVRDCLFGVEQDTLEAAIGRMLQSRSLRLATAESCTGGQIAHLITSVPGSSAYFQGSVVAYSNSVKEQVLGVSADTLSQHGAVSGPCVKEMVSGALDLLGADIALAVSGIAGPDGGTADKPVGTIWIAVGDKQEVQTIKIQAGRDRSKNTAFSSIMALNQLRLFILQRYPDLK